MSYFSLSGTASNKGKEDALVSFVKSNRSFVRKYLKKYGSEDRAFGIGAYNKGTKIKVGGRVIDLSKASVDKANDRKLAGMLAASIVNDTIHAVRIAGTISLGLGAGGGDIFQGIVELVKSIGPSIMQLITQLMTGEGAADQTLDMSFVPPPPEEKKIHPGLIAAGVAAAVIGVVAYARTRS